MKPFQDIIEAGNEKTFSSIFFIVGIAHKRLSSITFCSRNACFGTWQRKKSAFNATQSSSSHQIYTNRNGHINYGSHFDASCYIASRLTSKQYFESLGILLYFW